MKKYIYNKLSVFHFSEMINKNISKRKKKGLIFGNFGAMNLGDEAILSGELLELNKVKNLDIQVVSRNPREIVRLHNTRSFSVYNILKIIWELYKSDFVIVGGGGIICKADRIIIGVLYQLYTLVIYLLIPKIFNKPIYVIGIGIYNNSNPFVLYVVRFLLKSVKILTVRDFHSLNLLESYNMPVKIYKDNSYLMNPMEINDILKEKFIAKNLKIRKKNLGLALIRPEIEKEEKRLTAYVLDYVAKNYLNSSFWFYPCDHQKGFYNDEIFAEKLIKLINKKFGYKAKCFIIPSDWNPQMFFSSFKLMNQMITMRLHASIFAHRNNIEFTGISYDEKCQSFLKSIGKKPLVIHSASFDKTASENLIRIKKFIFTTAVHIRRNTYIALGVLDKLKPSSTNLISVVSYHSVEKDNWLFSIDPNEIKRQIKYLKSKYAAITLKDLEAFIAGRKLILKPSVVITFDDGYRDILKLKSFFKKNNIKPSLFLLARPQNANLLELGTKRDFLNKTEIISLIKDGWEIGSHTNTHPNLTNLNDVELDQEIYGAKKILEKDLGIKVRYFAYPRGKYNQKVLKYVRRADYKLGLSMDDGFITQNTDPLLVPRIGINRTHSFLEFKSLFASTNVNIRMAVKKSYIGRFV